VLIIGRRLKQFFQGPRRVDREGSVTQLIEQAKSGDSLAAQQLWDRYFQEAVRYANGKLTPQARKEADGEDIALSAFHSLLAGAKHEKFDDFHDRDNLWRLLSDITRKKAFNQNTRHKREKRGGGKQRGESVFAAVGIDPDEAAGIAMFAGKEPTPEDIHTFAELFEWLLDKLKNDELRQCALLRLQGYKHREIAEQIGKSVHRVEAKFRLIRKTWEPYLDSLDRE